MLNIVIPMAGKGQRFRDAGYTIPKPLISIGNETMIEIVARNLKPTIEHRYIFICQKDHIEKYDFVQKIKKNFPNSIFIGIEGVTNGQLSSVLLAKNYINNNDPVLCANSDQFINFNINDFLTYSIKNNFSGGCILTMKTSGNKWSYAKVDEKGFVTETAEKKEISNLGTCGLYFFSKGKNLVKFGEEMVAKNDKTNNEFYVCPVYNYLIKNNFSVGFFDVGNEHEIFFGLGTPEDLEFYKSKFYIKE